MWLKVFFFFFLGTNVVKVEIFFFGNQNFVFLNFFFIRSCTALKNKKDKEDLRRITTGPAGPSGT